MQLKTKFKFLCFYCKNFYSFAALDVDLYALYWSLEQSVQACIKHRYWSLVSSLPSGVRGLSWMSHLPNTYKSKNRSPPKNWPLAPVSVQHHNLESILIKDLNHTLFCSNCTQCQFLLFRKWFFHQANMNYVSTPAALSYNMDNLNIIIIFRSLEKKKTVSDNLSSTSRCGCCICPKWLLNKTPVVELVILQMWHCSSHDWSGLGRLIEEHCSIAAATQYFAKPVVVTLSLMSCPSSLFGSLSLRCWWHYSIIDFHSWPLLHECLSPIFYLT